MYTVVRYVLLLFFFFTVMISVKNKRFELYEFHSYDKKRYEKIQKKETCRDRIRNRKQATSPHVAAIFIVDYFCLHFIQTSHSKLLSENLHCGEKKKKKTSITSFDVQCVVILIVCGSEISTQRIRI